MTYFGVDRGPTNANMWWFWGNSLIKVQCLWVGNINDPSFMPTGSGFLNSYSQDAIRVLRGTVYRWWFRIMLGGGLLCPRFVSSMEGLYSLVIEDHNRNQSEKEKDQIVSSERRQKQSLCFRDPWTHFQESIREEESMARWFKVTFWSPSWRSLSLWKGHLTIPKRSLWITRGIFFRSISPEFPFGMVQKTYHRRRHRSRSRSRRSSGDLGFSSGGGRFFFWGGGRGNDTRTVGSLYCEHFLGGGFIFFHPYLGKIPIFDYIIFFKGVETTNQFCCWHLIFPGKMSWTMGWQMILRKWIWSIPQWQIKVLVTIPEPRNVMSLRRQFHDVTHEE